MYMLPARLLWLSRIFFLIGLCGALVFIIPVAWFPSPLGKITFFSLGLLLASVSFVFGRGVPELLRLPGLPWVFVGTLLPIAYIVSSYFSINPSQALLGNAIETDTILFTTLGFFTLLFSFILWRTVQSARLLLLSVSAALALAALFQFFVLTFDTTLIPFDLFSERSTNLVGKWNDLGLLLGLLVLLILVRLEFLTHRTISRIGLSIGAVLLAILLGVINFALAWGLVLFFSVLLFFVKFVLALRSAPQDEESASIRGTSRTAWFALAGAVVALLFLLFGLAFSTTVSNVFPVSSLEVRPSFSSTLSIAELSREGSLLRAGLGTGPNTFGEVWLLHKPQEVNRTLFWNLDFNVGFSTLTTALVTLGVLGMLVWLLVPFLILFSLLRNIRHAARTKEEYSIAVSLILGALYLFGALIFYVPSQQVVLLMFVLSGAALGFLWRRFPKTVEKKPLLQHPTLQKLGVLLVVLLLLLLPLTTSSLSVRRFLSGVFVAQGVSALAQGSYDDALVLASRAVVAERYPDSMRLALDAGATKLAALAGDSSLSPDTVQTQFVPLLQNTIETGQEAIALYKKDFRLYRSLARVYDLLASLQVANSYETAKQYYEAAITLNPTSPELLLSLARLEIRKGNRDSGNTYLTRSLTLKSNYTDAILFVVQLSVADNNIEAAIEAAKIAAQTAPGVAPIWFQLGVLYYSVGDMEHAVEVLEQAILIIPTYANAKYFLGLAYAALLRTEDALRQFEDIEQTNPNNAEVKLILQNLRAGKFPFEGAVPPITPKPQTRPTAPVEE